MMKRAAGKGRIRPAQIVVGIVAVAFVFGPGVLGVLGVREKPIENRALSPAPTLDQGFAAFDAVTPWAIDRLPGRAKAIELKGLMDYYGYGDLPGTQVAQPLQVAGAGGTADVPPGGGAGGSSLTPKVIRGSDGFLFFGTDFVAACEAQSGFATAVKRLQALVDVIERSGRTVVFTVAPDKSSVVRDKVPTAVPRGACARSAIDDQVALMDGMSSPQWMPLREQLTAMHRRGQDAYWKTDTHWTTLGGSVLAEAVADRLLPSGSRGFQITRTTSERVGDLTRMIGLDFTEIAGSVEASTSATVTEVLPPGHDPAKGIRQTAAWTSSPARDLVGGRSVLVGDSFMFETLPLLKPMFADGTFAWIGTTPDDEIVEHIKSSDTVVIEVVQRNLAGKLGLLAKPSFAKKVARALDVER